MKYYNNLTRLTGLFCFVMGACFCKVNAQGSQIFKASSAVSENDVCNIGNFACENKEVLSKSENKVSKDYLGIECTCANSKVGKENFDLENKVVDKIVPPIFKYKNYDCYKECSHKDKGKSYNLIDCYKCFRHSMNRVIFNMCSDCAVNKVLSDPSVNFTRNTDFKSITCNINYILDMLPNCCSHCYDLIYKALIMAYCSCPYQFNAKYNIFETAFDNNDDNVSYEHFLYSLRSRLFQDYFSEKADYDFTLNKAKEIDEEIEKSKIFRSQKSHNEN